MLHSQLVIRFRIRIGIRSHSESNARVGVIVRLGDRVGLRVKVRDRQSGLAESVLVVGVAGSCCNGAHGIRG